MKSYQKASIIVLVWLIGIGVTTGIEVKYYNEFCHVVDNSSFCATVAIVWPLFTPVILSASLTKYILP